MKGFFTLLLLFGIPVTIVVINTPTEQSPNFKVGDCIIDESAEFEPSWGQIEKVLKVGKRNYLLRYGYKKNTQLLTFERSITATNEQFIKTDNSLCERFGI